MKAHQLLPQDTQAKCIFPTRKKSSTKCNMNSKSTSNSTLKNSTYSTNPSNGKRMPFPLPRKEKALMDFNILFEKRNSSRESSKPSIEKFSFQIKEENERKEFFPSNRFDSPEKSTTCRLFETYRNLQHNKNPEFNDSKLNYDRLNFFLNAPQRAIPWKRLF